MKKIYLVAGAAIIAVIFAGLATAYFRPELLGMTSDVQVADTAGKEQPVADGAARDRKPNLKFKALVRSLGRIQDRIVYGERAALAEQEDLLLSLAEEFDDVIAGKWRSPPDVDDVLVYVLSGGEPEVLKRFTAGVPGTNTESALVGSVLSYMEHDEAKSREQFNNVNVRSLGPNLAGPVALAMSSTFPAEDAPKSLELLDIARISGAHTAVEEAAIRRTVPLLIIEKKLPESFQMLSDYVRRFGKSAYALGFFDTAAKALAANDATDGKTAILALSLSISDTDAAAQGEIMLAIALASLEKGRLAAARMAAESCLKVVGIPNVLQDRARLYLAAADAPSALAADAASKLSGLSGSELTPRDVKIRQAAIEIAASVTAPLKSSGGGRTDGVKSAGDQSEDLAGAAVALKRATKALEEASLMDGTEEP